MNLVRIDNGYEDAVFFEEFVFQDKKLRVALFDGKSQFYLHDALELFNRTIRELVVDDGLYEMLKDPTDITMNILKGVEFLTIQQVVDKDVLYKILYLFGVNWRIRDWLIEYVVPYLDQSFSSLQIESQDAENDQEKLGFINRIGESYKLLDELRRRKQEMEEYLHNAESTVGEDRITVINLGDVFTDDIFGVAYKGKDGIYFCALQTVEELKINLDEIREHLIPCKVIYTTMATTQNTWVINEASFRMLARTAGKSDIQIQTFIKAVKQTMSERLH